MLRNIEAELAKSSFRTLKMRDGRKERLGRSLMVQMPTGTGKTYVMATVIRDVEVDGAIWVIAHRRELVEPMKDTLTRFSIAFAECRSVGDLGKAKVCVMSIQWLSRNIKDIREHSYPNLIVIDEAHHSIAPTYQDMWVSFPKSLKIGFTATPCRLKAANFSTLFDTLLTSWSIRKFIEAGRLALYDYVVINRDSEEQRTIDSLARRGADGDYSVSEMDEKLNVDPTIVRLYRSVDKFAHGKKGIVYAINIRHARHIAEYYTSRGLNAVAIDSKTPATERKRTVDGFRQGETDVLVNVNLFDEGFDCPDVEFIQMARPTLSLAKYLQMVGRGLRVHPEKKMCVLIDNVGLCRQFGLPDAERDWDSTFFGKSAGRGILDRNRRKNLRIVNNEMEEVVNHSHLLPRTAEEERVFAANTVPFEKGGRWGLRSGDEIVLQPMYRKIEPFVGDYCAYSIADNRWGVLSRKGKVVVSPDYKDIEVSPLGTALLKLNDIYECKVNLKAEENRRQDETWDLFCECKLKKMPPCLPYDNASQF